MASSSSASSPVRIGVIGAGLMGREVASVFGRWFALQNFPVRAEVVAVCDLQPHLLDWFRQVPTVKHFLTDVRDLVKLPDVDVVYAAVPHHLHEEVYLHVLQSGKDLLAEKPFGIDLAAATRIRDTAKSLGRFVRVSSEFPFFPGAQRAVALAQSGSLGKILEARCAFLHASDLDPAKPINWKRQSATCGQAGVMNDLGLHVSHIPLRLGWKVQSLSAHLQKIYTQRPDGKGGMAPCDTWDNATVHCRAEIAGQQAPLTLEMKRLAPTETNTWIIELLGTDRGVRFSTKEPKTLWTYRRDKEQWWEKTDLGFQVPFSTITGGIFEPGFPDVLMQMWASFLAERAGVLNGRFGCATPDEAVAQHALWAAALESEQRRAYVEVK